MVSDAGLQRGEEGQTVLIKAYQEGRAKVAELLIEHGVDANIKNNKGGGGVGYSEKW